MSSLGREEGENPTKMKLMLFLLFLNKKGEKYIYNSIKNIMIRLMVSGELYKRSQKKGRN